MKDFLIDKDYDIATAEGDFVSGESDAQHQLLLLTSIPGEWKENPKLGIDAEAYINTEDISGLLTKVKKDFEADGMTVEGLPSIDDDGKLTVNATY
jgi:hypothetical protein